MKQSSSSASRTSRSSRRQHGGGGGGSASGSQVSMRRGSNNFSSTHSQASRASMRGSSTVSVSSRSAKNLKSNKPRFATASNTSKEDLQDQALLAAIDSLNRKTRSKSSKSSKRTPSEATRGNVDEALHKGAYPDGAYTDFKNLKDQVPAMIYTPPRVKSHFTSNKLCKIFVAPETPSELEPFCFLPIGEGSTFCLNQNRTTNHRGSGERVPVMPGEVFIMSDKTKAFKEPSSNSLLWDSHLNAMWSQESLTANEWMQRFNLVQTKMEIDPDSAIAHSGLNNEALFTQKIKNLQSVRKRKKTEPVVISPMDFSLGLDFGVKPENGFSLDSITQAIAILEGSLRSAISNVNLLYASSQDFRDYVEPSLIKSEQAFSDLLTRLGNKPHLLASEFDSPTLWSSLGLISSELHNVSNQVNFNWNKSTLT